MTAKQAREITSHTAHELLKAIMGEVESKAAEGKYTLSTAVENYWDAKDKEVHRHLRKIIINYFTELEFKVSVSSTRINISWYIAE